MLVDTSVCCLNYGYTKVPLLVKEILVPQNFIARFPGFIYNVVH